MSGDWNWKPTSPARARRRIRRSKRSHEDLPWSPMRGRRVFGDSSDAGARKAVEEVVGKVMRDGLCRCGFCGGAGQRPSGSTCPVCKGRGQIAMNPPAVRCAFCKGRGVSQPRSMITCLTCKGKGVVPIVEPMGICSQCNGSGRSSAGHHLSCGKCKGKGVVTTEGGMGRDAGQEKAFLRRPSGSERDVAEAIYRSGGESSVAEIASRIRVSTSYAEYICKSMAGKGYLERAGRTIYTLVPECEKTVEQGAISDLEEVDDGYK